jgi:hypothetical protein
MLQALLHATCIRRSLERMRHTTSEEERLVRVLPMFVSHRVHLNDTLIFKNR